jgi:hypothetical protein
MPPQAADSIPLLNSDFMDSGIPQSGGGQVPPKAGQFTHMLARSTVLDPKSQCEFWQKGPLSKQRAFSGKVLDAGSCPVCFSLPLCGIPTIIFFVNVEGD